VAIRRSCVLLLRHAEKPRPERQEAAVDEQGRPDEHDLAVRGWQRSGALARALTTQPRLHFLLGMPTFLLAPRPSDEHPSRRGISTLLPTSRLLGIPVQTPCAVGEEDKLAERLGSLQGTIVVAWEHARLPALAMRLVGERAVPSTWPEDRYDVGWMTSQGAFEQLPLLLLDGDLDRVIGA
jgi:hypothetical protein